GKAGSTVLLFRELSTSTSIFERDVLALDIAQFVQFLAKRLPVGAVVDDADARDLCCARTATRPCRRGRKSCCSANELYDLPAVHNSRPERRTRLAHSARTLPRDPKPLPFRRYRRAPPCH